MSDPFAGLGDDDLVKLGRRALRDLPDAPPGWVDRAVALFAAQPAATPAPLPSWSDLGRRVLAQLRFDSWAAQPLLAVRHARGASRHLLFTAEGHDIDLRVAPRPGSTVADARYALVGQVLGPDDRGEVRLRRAATDDAANAPAPSGDPAATEVCALDAYGEFRFETVAPGRYVLELRVGQAAIELPAIDVGDVSSA